MGGVIFFCSLPCFSVKRKRKHAKNKNEYITEMDCGKICQPCDVVHYINARSSQSYLAFCLFHQFIVCRRKICIDFEYIVNTFFCGRNSLREKFEEEPSERKNCEGRGRCEMCTGTCCGVNSPLVSGYGHI